MTEWVLVIVFGFINGFGTPREVDTQKIEGLTKEGCYRIIQEVESERVVINAFCVEKK